MLYKASEHEIEVNEVAIPCTYGDEKSYVTKIHALKYMLFIIGLLGRKFKVKIISNPIAAKLGN